jgi:glyoxylase-like metal-dependent hydrolase (beta-lactamase superfamily II)
MLQIADHIYYIEAENRGRYPYCHSLLVKDDVSVIIDPACREDLMRSLGANGGADIILNTHYHEDHRTFNFCFERARLYVHELDAPGYGPVDDFMSDFSVANPAAAALKNFWRDFLLENCKYRPYRVEKTFSDGFELNLGHTVVQAIHTPGHSAGHCCFHFPREEVVYLGDIDLTSFGPWYASRNSGIDAFLSSIERIRRLKPKKVITSHGDGLVSEEIDARLEAYAAVIHRRDSQILDFLSQPRSLEEILDLEVVYRRAHKAPDSFFCWDDRMMIEMHLARLLRLGLIKTLDKKYSLG